jgi:hypothetical protein
MSTFKVATGKEKPRDGLNELRQDAAIPLKQAASIGQSAISVKSAMHNYVADRVGHVASFVMDLGDFAEHYSLSSAVTTTTYADMVIEKGNLRYILCIPLAAAIRKAKDRFTCKDKSHPIPSDIKDELVKSIISRIIF